MCGCANHLFFWHINKPLLLFNFIFVVVIFTFAFKTPVWGITQSARLDLLFSVYNNSALGRVVFGRRNSPKMVSPLFSFFFHKRLPSSSSTGLLRWCQSPISNSFIVGLIRLWFFSWFSHQINFFVAINYIIFYKKINSSENHSHQIENNSHIIQRSLIECNMENSFNCSTNLIEHF